MIFFHFRVELKGQLISKCLFGVFNSPKKKNENNSTWGTIVVKSNFFVRFLGELKIPKRHFEINWPPDLFWMTSFYNYFRLHLLGIPFILVCRNSNFRINLPKYLKRNIHIFLDIFLTYLLSTFLVKWFSDAFCNIFTYFYRGVSGGGAGGAIAHPVFGRIEGAARQRYRAALLLAHPVLNSNLSTPLF